MPIVGQATALVASAAISSSTPSMTSEAARLGDRAWRRRGSCAASASLLAARAVAAERVDRLRGQADMADHRDAARGEEGDRRGHRLAALELDRRRAGLLEHARGVAERLLGRLLIGAERHVDRDQRMPDPRTTAAPCAHIMSRLTGMVEGRP